MSSRDGAMSRLAAMRSITGSRTTTSGVLLMKPESAIAAAVVFIALVAAALWAGRADMRLLSEIYLYLALATLWNLLAGYTGLVSVGQQAFVGFGGYSLFALAIFAGAPPLREIEIDFKRWESAANGHHQRIREILFREYEDRKRQLDRRYAERIEAAEQEERKRRLEAIALTDAPKA